MFPTPEGKRIEDEENCQAQMEADVSERGRARPPGSGSGTVHQLHQFRSVSSYRAFGAAAREHGPAVMALRPEPAQPLDQALTA